MAGKDESECGVSASDLENKPGQVTAYYFWFLAALAAKFSRA